MENTSSKYGEFIVYVDESGDHSLESINPRFPLFVLSLCVFRKTTYAYEVSPSVRMLKFATFGHDMVILHEQEIRKKTGPFSMLNKGRREKLIEDLSNLIAATEFTLIPIVIDKFSLREYGLDSPHVYHLAMRLGLEQLYKFINTEIQQDRHTHVIFEARGRTEDLALEAEFRRVCDCQNSFGKVLPFEIILADKKTNSSGLQFADMVARPIGLAVLRPQQPNRAFEILRKKLYSETESPDGPFIFPKVKKAKGPEVVLEAQTPVG